jgi:hypothetical protein
MLVIKYVLIAGAVGLLISAAAVLLFDACRVARSLVPPAVRWRLAARLAVLAWLPLLPALSIAVVPSGMAGVRVSQVSGTLGGTLYPGTHFIIPLIHHVQLYTVRDQITAVVPSGSQVTLAASAPDSTSSAARGLHEALVTLLVSHRVRVVDAGDGVVSVAVSCSANLRERSCVAAVQRDTTRDTVIVTRPHDGAAGPHRRPQASLELQPLFSQRTAILDVVTLGDRPAFAQGFGGAGLLVLDASSVTVYRRAGQSWQPVSSHPLPTTRLWPRDLRGRLQVDDDRFVAFLPGLACAGRLSRAALDCAESRQPWPLGIDNNGLEPARNYFSTPEGLQFYGVAPLGANPDARWLVADRNGTLSFLDTARRFVASAVRADDVAGIAAPCAPDTYVVAADGSAGREALRLFQVARQRLVPAASPVFITGKLTALWAAPGATTAIAIAHDMSDGRHEAFLATVACGR